MKATCVHERRDDIYTALAKKNALLYISCIYAYNWRGYGTVYRQKKKSNTHANEICRSQQFRCISRVTWIVVEGSHRIRFVKFLSPIPKVDARSLGHLLRIIN